MKRALTLTDIAGYLPHGLKIKEGENIRLVV